MPTAWDDKGKEIVMDNKSNKPRIAICVPYNSNWPPEWVEKTYCPLRYIPVDWCIKVNFLCKVPSLPVARSTLVNNALTAGCSYIFFIDTDIIFEQPSDPNMALNILYHVINKDPNSKSGKIVSGLYRAKQTVGFNWCAWMRASEKGFLPITNWTGNWLEVSVCGLGCTLIDMEVFKNIKPPYFYWEDINGISEDFYFCELAKKQGYDTHIFTDIRASHLGNLKVRSDGSFITPEM